MTNPIADRVRQRLKETGLSAREVSRQAMGNDNAVQNILSGRTKSPRGETASRLADVLGVSVDWLLNGVESQGQVGGEVRQAQVALPQRAQMPRDIPVHGTAAGSMNGRGAFQVSPDVIDYVARPPGLANARDVYAVYVEGESMAPRYYPGDLIFVHPHKPVRVDDVVIIQEPDSNNGTPVAFIKIFKRRSDKGVITRQLNPESEIVFTHSRLVMHKVLTMNELFGL